MYVPLVTIEFGSPVEVPRTERALMLVAEVNAAHVLLQVLLGKEARWTKVALMSAEGLESSDRWII